MSFLQNTGIYNREIKSCSKHIPGDEPFPRTLKKSPHVFPEIRLDSFSATATFSISINNVVFCKPTHSYRSDASKCGMGGYNLVSGNAWCFRIPIDYPLRTSLNSLEFLAFVITIWLDTLAGNIPPESCLLSQTDSTTTARWLRKS
jgi:hypothetical protein